LEARIVPAGLCSYGARERFLLADGRFGHLLSPQVQGIAGSKPKIQGLHFDQPTMPKALASRAATPLPSTYEAALEEIEQLVARIESGDMPLEQLLSAYQRGAELLKFCRDRLEAVENQIKVLDEGALKPWTSE
jgi:exodeoxyribonuclease VII small subunit